MDQNATMIFYVTLPPDSLWDILVIKRDSIHSIHSIILRTNSGKWHFEEVWWNPIGGWWGVDCWVTTLQALTLLHDELCPQHAKSFCVRGGANGKAKGEDHANRCHRWPFEDGILGWCQAISDSTIKLVWVTPSQSTRGNNEQGADLRIVGFGDSDNSSAYACRGHGTNINNKLTITHDFHKW